MLYTISCGYFLLFFIIVRPAYNKHSISEKKEQHQCPTCGVIMTTFIDRKRIKGEDVLSVIIDRESLRNLKPGYESIGQAWLGEGESHETA